MEFDQLRTLLAVLEHGSFTRAADVLGVSQSTVSSQIKGLESSLGVRLLDRSREGVSATPQGQQLQGYATRLLSLRQEAEALFAAHEEGLAGRVKIAASSIPGEYMLPDHLAAFRGSHPGVDVSITVSDSRRALGALAGGECDFAVVGTPSGDRRIELFEFGHDAIVLVAPAGHTAARGGTWSLRGSALVLRAEGSGTRAAVGDLLASARADGSHGPTVEVGSSQAVVRCVLAGLGLGFVSRLAAAQELADGRIEEVAIDGLPVKRKFFVARRRTGTLSAGAQALHDVLLRRTAVT